MNAVKTNLKRLRTAKGMTQDVLAEKLHVVRQTVSSWETGKTTPDVETLAAIAEALEVDITELIYGAKPVDKEAMLRKKYITQTVIFIILAVSVGLIGTVWADLLIFFGLPDTFSSDFNPFSLRHLLHLFGKAVFPMLAYVVLGIALTTAAKAKWKLSFLTYQVQNILCTIGTVLLLFYIIFITCVMTPIQYPSSLVQVAVWFHNRPYFLCLGGTLVGLKLP